MHTTVRQPRVVVMWLVSGMLALLFGVSMIARVHHGGFAPVVGQMWWWVIGPIFAAIQARPKIEMLDVDASREGIRVGVRSIPRSKLKTALLRREADKTFVLLRGKGLRTSVDVEVPNDEKADELCTALGLDAKTTTAEFALMRPSSSPRRLFVIAGLVFAAAMVGLVTAATHLHTPVLFIGLIVLFAVTLPMLIFAQQVKLRIGADGLVVQQMFGRRKFFSHDDIDYVMADGRAVVIKPKHGDEVKLTVGGQSKTRQAKDLDLQAQSIVWRVEKAREAFVALAGNVPDAAALARGSRSSAEWLEQLRRVGEGATATFRSANLTREQLFAIVESTTALARERLAALVALHAGLSEDEKPRIRVAADRCVRPALREKMVRVADASTDDDLLLALDEAESAETRART